MLACQRAVTAAAVFLRREDPILPQFYSLSARADSTARKFRRRFIPLKRNCYSADICATLYMLKLYLRGTNNVLLMLDNSETCGLTVDALKSLNLNGEANSTYDFAFVDAEKRMYQEYYELVLLLVTDPKTITIRNFNRNLVEDKRVSINMVPIGDGMTICQEEMILHQILM